MIIPFDDIIIRALKFEQLQFTQYSKRVQIQNDYFWSELQIICCFYEQIKLNHKIPKYRKPLRYALRLKGTTFFNPRRGEIHWKASNSMG